jgi:hypothetical protein
LTKLEQQLVTHVWSFGRNKNSPQLRSAEEILEAKKLFEKKSEVRMSFLKAASF